MLNTPAEGIVHAKTGTHGNVSALSGFVKTLNGEKLAFSMIFNGASVGRYKAIENNVAAYLAGLK
jgi:D-alanyl-D-alanine carboxypeptidase/D-alanyl-D-alanine-endopeptidase (penicillin-binding protein 4)